MRVIIYEQDEPKRAPMFYFLQRRQLVEVLSYFSSQTHMPLAVETSREEWHKRGENLRDNGMLVLAAKCFAKAGDLQLENEVTAQQLANDALREKDARRRRQVFFEAAERFLAAGHRATLHAAKCFVEAGELRLAAQLFCLSGAHLHQAVRCYRQLGDFTAAVDLLLQHGRVRRALEILKRESKPEAALRVLDSHPEFVPPDELLSDNFVEAAIVAVERTTVSDSQERQAVRDKLLALVSWHPNRMSALRSGVDSECVRADPKAAGGA